jgi:hypothetical protein
MALTLRPILPESIKARRPGEFGARIVTSGPPDAGVRQWRQFSDGDATINLALPQKWRNCGPNLR